MSTRELKRRDETLDKDPGTKQQIEYCVCPRTTRASPAIRLCHRPHLRSMKTAKADIFQRFSKRRPGKKQAHGDGFLESGSGECSSSYLQKL
jgi:hypothetical protein